jgi:transcriptional regulator with XRE-family HTH domain
MWSAACGTTSASRVERAVQAPSLLAIYALCKALGIAPSDLFKQVEAHAQPA